MFEDKMKEALDMGLYGKKTDKKSIEAQGKAQRQKQTKRILEGFHVELESKLIQHSDQLQAKYESVYDRNYGVKLVTREC